MGAGVKVRCEGCVERMMLAGAADTPEGFHEQVSQVSGIRETLMRFNDEAGFVTTPANVLAESCTLQAKVDDGSTRCFKISIQGPVMVGDSSISSFGRTGKKKLIVESGGGNHWKDIIKRGLPLGMLRYHETGLYVLKFKNPW